MPEGVSKRDAYGSKGWDVVLMQRWQEMLWFGIQGEDALGLTREFVTELESEQWV